MFKEIKKLHKQGYKRVAGLDEAGRGPLAGPVVAAAMTATRELVINSKKLAGIKDSKKLSAKQREEWYKILIAHSNINYGIGIISEKIIDRINILEATKLAMTKAIHNLEKKIGNRADFLIVDGNFSIRIARSRASRGSIRKRLSEYEQKSIVKADEKIFLCMAAGIIAKVRRDRIMKRLHKKYPQYGFDRHKGYGTKVHLRALRKHGACEIHRKSFRPVSRLI